MGACIWLAAALLVGGCSDSGDPSSRSRDTFAESIPEAGPIGAPTPDAAAAGRDLLSDAGSALDCGTVAADGGWPTTTQALLMPTDCLVAAVTSGEAALLRYTGRTGDGGALVAEYRAKPGGLVEVVSHTIDADGAVSTTKAECKPPPGTWATGVGGRVVVVETNTSYC